jgi:hypothetical protein
MGTTSATQTATWTLVANKVRIAADVQFLKQAG